MKQNKDKGIYIFYLHFTSCPLSAEIRTAAPDGLMLIIAAEQLCAVYSPTSPTSPRAPANRWASAVQAISALS